MLTPVAFASALAALTALVYLAFTLLALVSPSAFQLVFNAQFFGADVASLFPRVPGPPRVSPHVRHPRSDGVGLRLGLGLALQRLCRSPPLISPGASAIIG